jgi:Domain of unknown function (DUF929)
MLGSGPDDGDVLEMGPQRPTRSWSPGRRARLALAGVCALLLVAGGTIAALRLNSPSPGDPALAKLITEVTTVPVNAAGSGSAVGSGGAIAYQGALPASAAPGSTGSPDSIASSSSLAAASSSGQFAAVSAGSGSVLLFNGYATPAGPNARPLTSAGKPEVLYMATEFCPYCSAQSWPLIIALSHFGTFTGLNVTRSPTFEGLPPVDGWTFYGSSYTSRYLAFAPVETYSNVLVSPKANPADRTSYRKLQSLTSAEQAAVHQLDVAGQTPFTDFGGKFAETGSDIVPAALAGLTWSQIAADLHRPASTAGAAILFTAGVLTAELCQLTDNRPVAVCAQS